jgi:hypothetical protein
MPAYVLWIIKKLQNVCLYKYCLRFTVPVTKNKNWVGPSPDKLFISLMYDVMRF